MVDVLISIGSNIEKEKNVARCLQKLMNHTRIEDLRTSNVYETVALDKAGHSSGQPSFFNLAVQCKTDLTFEELSQTLRNIEACLGRVRTDDKYAPREIDLDIVFFGQEPFEAKGKPYPDPSIAYFPHIIFPLSDIAANWSLPMKRTSGLCSGAQEILPATIEECAELLRKEHGPSAQILRVFELD